MLKQGDMPIRIELQPHANGYRDPLWLFCLHQTVVWSFVVMVGIGGLVYSQFPATPTWPLIAVLALAGIPSLTQAIRDWFRRESLPTNETGHSESVSPSQILLRGGRGELARVIANVSSITSSRYRYGSLLRLGHYQVLWVCVVIAPAAWLIVWGNVHLAYLSAGCWALVGACLLHTFWSRFRYSVDGSILTIERLRGFRVAESRSASLSGAQFRCDFASATAEIETSRESITLVLTNIARPHAFVAALLGGIVHCEQAK